MVTNDDKDGDDNNMGKMTSQIEIEIQNYQKFSLKMCASPVWKP